MQIITALSPTGQQVELSVEDWLIKKNQGYTYVSLRREVVQVVVKPISNNTNTAPKQCGPCGR